MKIINFASQEETFQENIHNFHKDVFQAIQKSGIDLAVEFRAGERKVILSLDLHPDNYSSGKLELWYHFEGYYWYRFIVAGSGKKYSASELLTTAFISEGLKTKLDAVFAKILERYNAQLNDLSKNIDRYISLKSSALGITTFSVRPSNIGTYDAEVLLPIRVDGGYHSDYFVRMRFKNNLLVGPILISPFVKTQVTLETIFQKQSC